MMIESLLREWCEEMLLLQKKDTAHPELDGGIWCPACKCVHGRCFEAMYPFLYMASLDRDEKWIKAAEALFNWAERNVSQADGSFLNDVNSGWKGTTVFNAIQLADCLLLHGDSLSAQTRRRWTERLRRAAQFLYTFEELNENNINYPVSNALALYECGLVFLEECYIKRAGELAALAEDVWTEHGLLFGEGVPRYKTSAKGCCPVDIGYNVEETLPSLALYGYLSGDKKAFLMAEKGLEAQLPFLLDNGAWDNSFGTRNYKWTYWGSRTSDGCALGYLLFAKTHPEFAAAAHKNMELLKKCTYGGLLAGGPHYQMAGQSACVHHTFTHAKVLAGILDRHLYMDVREEVKLPRQQAEGLHYYPEIESWLANKASMTATVTAYDWEYLPGGHVSGGTISLWHHCHAGTLLCAGMGEYTLKEPDNMQIPAGVIHECLALRIEKHMGETLYSSIYEDCAEVLVEENVIMVRGCLKDICHKAPPDKELAYTFRYEWRDNALLVRAEFADGILICPLISRSDEDTDIRKDGKAIRIKKEQTEICLEASGDMELPYGTERIFNLVPGLQALRVDMSAPDGSVEFLISVLE